MKRIASFYLLAFLFSIIFGLVSSYAEDEGGSYVVIANKDVPASSISLKMLKRIYLKDMTNWEVGGPVNPVDLDEENSLRAAFSKKILGKGVDEMRSYWINQKLTNNLSPPVSLKNSQSVKKFVSQNPGAIGYIKQNEADASVKVLTVDP